MGKEQGKEWLEGSWRQLKCLPLGSVKWSVELAMLSVTDVYRS